MPPRGWLRPPGSTFTPYYALIAGGFLMTAPGIVGMVIGFLLLDERDARTLAALRVTPLSMRRYLAYRVTLPLLVGTLSTLIGYPLIGISPLPLSALVPIAMVAGLAAPLLALVLAIAAPNKVAGFAVVKVLNGVNLLQSRRSSCPCLSSMWPGFFRRTGPCARSGQPPQVKSTESISSLVPSWVLPRSFSQPESSNADCCGVDDSIRHEESENLTVRYLGFESRSSLSALVGPRCLRSTRRWP